MKQFGDSSTHNWWEFLGGVGMAIISIAILSRYKKEEATQIKEYKLKPIYWINEFILSKHIN